MVSLGGRWDAQRLVLGDRHGVVSDRTAAAYGPARCSSGGRSQSDLRHRAHAALRRALAGLPRRVRALHDGLQPVQSLEPAGHLAGHVRGLDRAKPDPRDGRHRCHPHQGASLRRGRKRGAYVQAIGASRGGRTTKIHALSDDLGRPCVLLLTPGNINDMSVAAALIRRARPFARLLADRGYDARHLRDLIAERGAEAVIPSTRSRKVPIPHDTRAYRARNLAERLWCRLKDWRRLATRYDKLAANFMATALIAAIFTFWCN